MAGGAQRVLITGASGMLGAALVDALAGNHECLAVSRGPADREGARWLQGDLLDHRWIASTLERNVPDVIVHAAAVTNVDLCERDARMTRKLHVEATELLASYCIRRNAKLVYVSTDSVFDGRKSGPYVETDVTGPLNLYGSTKLEGEARALESPRGLVLRTNIFGWRPVRHDSFGEWVLRALRAGSSLTMFTDVVFTPVATTLLARVVGECLDKDVTGLFHAGGSEVVSKCEFAYRVAAAYGLNATGIVPILVTDKPLTAERPRNMALDSSRLAARLGRSMPSLSESINAWQKTEPVL